MILTATLIYVNAAFGMPYEWNYIVATIIFDLLIAGCMSK